MKALLTFILLLVFISSCAVRSKLPNSSKQESKVVIYQMLPRLFGNKISINKHHGSIIENGTGKFNDIDEKALRSLHAMGISHIWYTGILEHATMTDYTQYGIRKDDPDVVKGRAGSPYAIKDYYDVDPDLAVEVNKRLEEFEALVARTHQQEMKVLIDFVPNHVARFYYSDQKPAGTRDFGADDDTSMDYLSTNDFYYITNHKLKLPEGINAGGTTYTSELKDGEFIEMPAKVTGNNVFSNKPTMNDWFETVKLNYGIDHSSGDQTHFNPVPPVWTKMLNILSYWADKKVDGFRCDVVEMVPVEFWAWVIPQLKLSYPNLIFIGEAYDPTKYNLYIEQGKFDFLYDKVGLYDTLKRLVRNEHQSDVKGITAVLNSQGEEIQHKMLRFLENHDEERIASNGFAGSPLPAIPAMVISATLSNSPIMVYSGQEVGEPGKGSEGFGTEDNRTTIFDYWGVPEHQKWMNNGLFDGGMLTENQKELRNFYSTLLNLAANHPALIKGSFVELREYNANSKTYAYIRKEGGKRLLIINNFDREKEFLARIPISKLTNGRLNEIRELLSNEKIEINKGSAFLELTIKPSGAGIFEY